jgi:hypothetical protein
MKSTAHPCPVVVEIQRETLKAKYPSWTRPSRSDSKGRSECGEVKNDHHQKTGARRGVGSVLTYRVFPGSKAGEIPGATGNRISRNPTERRAPKPAGVISSRSLPCPESQGVAAVRGKPIPTSPPQRPHCHARNLPPVKRLVASTIDLNLERSKSKLLIQFIFIKKTLERKHRHFAPVR